MESIDPNSAEFDRWATEYRSLHAASITASGESPEYFAEYKVKDLAFEMGEPMQEWDILDFGCGIGNSIPYLAAQFPNSTITGADVSSTSLSLAEARYKGRASFVHFQGKTPFHTSSYDVALVAGVFHHIEPALRAKTMEEIHRVVRPGGRIMLYEHNPLNPLTVRAVCDCEFDENAVLLRAGEAIRLVQGAGFESVRVCYRVFFPRALRALRPLERLFARVPLGAQYYVLGRKSTL